MEDSPNTQTIANHLARNGSWLRSTLIGAILSLYVFGLGGWLTFTPRGPWFETSYGFPFVYQTWSDCGGGSPFSIVAYAADWALLVILTMLGGLIGGYYFHKTFGRVPLQLHLTTVMCLGIVASILLGISLIPFKFEHQSWSMTRYGIPFTVYVLSSDELGGCDICGITLNLALGMTVMMLLASRIERVLSQKHLGTATI